MLNNISITGRLTHDPELRRLESGVAVTNFSLAVQRNYKVGDEYPTDFPDFVAWRATAEFICKYFKKGSMITIVGSIETRKYVDKDGNNRKAVEIKAEEAYFGDSAKKDNGNSGEQDMPAGYGGSFEPDFGGDDSALPFEGGFPAFGG